MVLAYSVGSDTVDPLKEMMAESAKRKNSAPGELASRQTVLDYRNMTPVDATRSPQRTAGVAEAPHLVAQSASGELRLCL